MTAAAPPGDPSPEEEARFRLLFDAHLPDVWAFARRRCASAAEADDVAGETFAVAWRRRDSLPAGEERLWLFGAARRVLANQQRATRRQDALRLRLATTAAAGPPSPSGPAAGDDVDPRADRLWAALAELAAEDRELILLRSWDELAVGEIAVLLDCTPNAASLRLHRARRRLAAVLEATDDPCPGQVRDDPRTEEGDAP